MLEATNIVIKKLEGTWGLVIIDRQNPKEIVTCANGSPIVIGIGRGKMFVASETTAFNRHTKSFIALKQNEVAVVTADGHSLTTSKVEQAPHLDLPETPHPYKYWTLKEIMEQPQAVARTLNYGSRLDGNEGAKLGGLQENREKLLSIKHLVIAACGTSLFAGMYGSLLMRSLDAFETVRRMIFY